MDESHEKMITFEKYHGAGNDFIIIDGRKFPLRDPFATSRILCKRHFSIGADDLLYLEESKVADIKMHICEPDGTEASMCGNGIRCVASYLLRDSKKSSITIETLSGIKTVFKKGDLFTVEMGKMQPIGKFMVPHSDRLIIKKEINSRTYYIVSAGEPHIVTFVKDIDQLDIAKNAFPIAHNFKMFPEGINVDFVGLKNDNIHLRTFERGVWNETLACGTGAVSSAFVTKMIFNRKDEMKVQMKGGTLIVSFKDERAFLTGKAEFVFKGEIGGVE